MFNWKVNEYIFELLKMAICAWIIVTIILELANGFQSIFQVNTSTHSNLLENFTEMEIAKLENGEPIQVGGWYRLGEENHAMFCRLLPIKRKIADDQLECYGVVMEVNADQIMRTTE